MFSKEMYKKSIEKDTVKRIALVSFMYKPGYMKNARCDFVSWSGTQWYPIQLGYLAAFLTGKGYDVKIIDAQAYSISTEKVVKDINAFKPHNIVIYAGGDSFEEDMILWDFLDNNVTDTVLAGPFYALNADKYRVPGIQGELEDGVLDWLEGKIKVDDKPVVGSPLTTEQLDAMPFVSDIFMEQLNPKFYRTPSEKWPFVDIMTGRGCIYGKCTYCVWPKVYKSGYTARSMENVIEEIKKIDRLGFYKSIMIQDDTFPTNRIEEFCYMKAVNRIKIPWSCLVRANLGTHTLNLMKVANCMNLHVGYESGCDKTLERVKKGISKEQMYDFTIKAKKAKLRIHGDFMIGIDKSEKEIKETIDWACKLNPDTAQFQIYIPYDNNEQCEVSPERLRQLARYAYRKFYSRPVAWKEVIKQVTKPSVLKESIKTVLGVRR
jgi:hypothetical protein